ncbi:PREDICTED: uncharacterized protein LOC108362563 [Rhagoletis zephyria]|uniref:uncharacterized protein LOC108362563 n=1 Tax=Rhagoletis zephyria TaxID=28612 RepID=UPI0008114089|nr:PREDICTED: uncharacterized protein LOC108362563 [Rhagoletis zephyria]
MDFVDSDESDFDFDVLQTKAAEERRGIYGTGGGPATPSTPLTGVEERMLAMLNDKEMEGIANTCDSDTVLADVHLAENNTSTSPALETPLPGPATLRKKMSAPLWTPRRLCDKNPKTSSWENLASIKSKWTESKFQADVALAKKEEERVELQMKLMRERHELEVLQHKERQAIEMEILSVRLEKEKLELKKLYNV